jgi:hypothetical protein
VPKRSNEQQKKLQTQDKSEVIANQAESLKNLQAEQNVSKFVDSKQIELDIPKQVNVDKKTVMKNEVIEDIKNELVVEEKEHKTLKENKVTIDQVKDEILNKANMENLIPVNEVLAENAVKALENESKPFENKIEKVSVQDQVSSKAKIENQVPLNQVLVDSVLGNLAEISKPAEDIVEKIAVESPVSEKAKLETQVPFNQVLIDSAVKNLTQEPKSQERVDEVKEIENEVISQAKVENQVPLNQTLVDSVVKPIAVVDKQEDKVSEVSLIKDEVDMKAKVESQIPYNEVLVHSSTKSLADEPKLAEEINKITEESNELVGKADIASKIPFNEVLADLSVSPLYKHTQPNENKIDGILLEEKVNDLVKISNQIPINETLTDSLASPLTFDFKPEEKKIDKFQVEDIANNKAQVQAQVPLNQTISDSVLNVLATEQKPTETLAENKNETEVSSKVKIENQIPVNDVIIDDVARTIDEKIDKSEPSVKQVDNVIMLEAHIEQPTFLSQGVITDIVNDINEEINSFENKVDKESIKLSEIGLSDETKVKEILTLTDLNVLKNENKVVDKHSENKPIQVVESTKTSQEELVQRPALLDEYSFENMMDQIVDKYGNFLWGSKENVKESSVKDNDTESKSVLSQDAKFESNIVSQEQNVPQVVTELLDENKAPRFTQRLANQEFSNHDNVHLDCFVEGEKPISVNWLFNNNTINPRVDSNIEIYRELGVCSMEIISATKKYQGEYKCHAKNDYGTDTTSCLLQYKDIQKEEILEFIEPLRDQVVELRSEVFLDCTVKNIRKTDTIEWYLNHNLIEPSIDSNVEIFTELGVCSLQIREMNPELQGFYSCRVKDTNDLVVAETGCYLSIEEVPNVSLTNDLSKLSYFSIVPVFVNELNDKIYVKENESLTLLCRLNDDCEPKPNVIWLKDGMILENTENEYKSTFVPKTGECRLHLVSFDKLLHQGTYSCVATVPDSTNEIVAKTSTRVKLSHYFDSTTDESSDERTEPINRGIAPMFLQSLQDLEVEEGDDIELKCQIMGAPIPEIICFFTKDINEKSSIKKIRSNFIDYNFETGICRINMKNVSFNTNDGFYIVKAYNDAGSLSTICQVKVNFKSFPTLNVVEDCEPKFLKELESPIRVMDGQEVCMTCICVAKPEPEINWLRSTFEDKSIFEPVVFTSDIKSSFDPTTGKCTLKINDTYPQDAGVFVCVASNNYGKAETRTQLIVECKA